MTKDNLSTSFLKELKSRRQEMAMMWRILVAALGLGSLGCNTEAEKQRQEREAESVRSVVEPVVESVGPTAGPTEKQRQEREAESVRSVAEPM